MDARRFLAATLLSAAVMTLAAGVWHELVMPHFYASQSHAKHEGVVIIFIAYLILGLFMAYLYPRLSLPGTTLDRGLRFGALMGLLWVFPHELAMAGAHSEPLAYVFKNAAWHVVEQAIGGVIVALSYRRAVAKEACDESA